MKKNKQEIVYVDNPRGFLAGVLLGGLAGAGAMLLLAPQSGKKTRANIEKKGRKLGKKTAKSIEGSVDQVRAKAHEVVINIQDQVEELQQRGQDVVEAQKERWAPVVEAGKTAVHDGN